MNHRLIQGTLIVKHQAIFGWIGRNQKTTKTTCGIQVKACNIAIDANADCPACIAEAESQNKSKLAVLSAFKERYGKLPETVTPEDIASLTTPVKLTTVYFL